MLQLKRILKAILKYKTSSTLTLISLIISFLGIIILTLYVSFEKSFDRFHENAQSVYRIETKAYGSLMPGAASELIQEIPEVEDMVVLSFYAGKTLSFKSIVTTTKLNETNINFESGVMFTGNSFFDMFTFPLKLGNPATALKEPNTVVLTETLSEKLFGTANPIGETIFINDEAFKVTALMNDFPNNSSFRLIVFHRLQLI